MEVAVAEQTEIQAAATPNPKLQIAGEIGRLETEIAKAESGQREIERKLQSAKGNRTAGIAAALIGVVAFVLFFRGFGFVLGIFLLIIGLLAWFTASFK
jgi:hypothetical protein